MMLSVTQPRHVQDPQEIEHGVFDKRHANSTMKTGILLMEG